MLNQYLANVIFVLHLSVFYLEGGETKVFTTDSGFQSYQVTSYIEIIYALQNSVDMRTRECIGSRVGI